MMTTMVVSKIFEDFMKLGFSENEARAYLQLLSTGPVSAYELAKVSGIPGSKIYQVLGRLCDKQAVVQLEEQGKALYAPLPSDDLIEAHRQEMEAVFQTVRHDIRSWQMEGQSEGQSNYVWNIRAIKELRARVSLLLASAKKTILVSGYNQDLVLMEPDFTSALERGVKIALVHFGPTSLKLGVHYQHPLEDTLISERGGRMLALVVDQSAALTATISPQDHVEGAWSRNPGFALLAEDYIKHDIYVTRIVERFGPELVAEWGERFAGLRDVFQGGQYDSLD